SLLAHLHDLLASSAAGPRLLALTPPEMLAAMERAPGGRRSSPIESGEQSSDAHACGDGVLACTCSRDGYTTHGITPHGWLNAPRRRERGAGFFHQRGEK